MQMKKRSGGSQILVTEVQERDILGEDTGADEEALADDEEYSKLFVCSCLCVADKIP